MPRPIQLLLRATILGLMLAACGSAGDAPAPVVSTPTPIAVAPSLRAAPVTPAPSSTAAHRVEGAASTALPPDLALCNPSFAAFARLHPSDWEQRTDPSIRPLIGWQRITGRHAEVIGWSDEAPNPTYTHPRVVIDVVHWDRTDLFALGLPRTYHGKPVVIDDLKEIPMALPAYPPGMEPTPASAPDPEPGCSGTDREGGIGWAG